MLADYACKFPRGREYNENDENNFYNSFEIDKNRIIFSNAFRRLAHKTQVLLTINGDHYRSRLTHSMEVANIASIISKRLRLSVDLTECIALAHDLGHPPFGHTGEAALNECMKDYGGFDHNDHSMRLLTHTEGNYGKGLNLSWEVLEGIAKHNGPLADNDQTYITQFCNNRYDLELSLYPSMESQVASIADDIAYNIHDIEDGIRSNIIQINDLLQIDITGQLIYNLKKEYQNDSIQDLLHKMLYRLVYLFQNDIISNVNNNIINFDIKSLHDIKNLGQAMVTLSNKMQNNLIEIKKFLRENFYMNYKVAISNLQCKKIIKKLFELYINHFDCIPTAWQNCLNKDQHSSKEAIVMNYIAGMTDRYALKQYGLFFNLTQNGI